MVTKEAIIKMKAGIRTLSGIKFLIILTTKFDMINTKVVANPIPNPFRAEVVTPNAGHNPKRRTNTGFSLKNPFVKLLT
jgi:hypothetical protein